MLCIIFMVLFFIFEPSIEFFTQTFPKKGYISRNCGFSRGYNKCDICTGIIDDLGGVQKSIYIDCDQGNNQIDCGKVSNPCKSIKYSFDNHYEVGKQMIYCFRGVCKGEELIQPNGDGINGYNVVLATESETYDFQYPSEPLMLVGWDYNNNGIYPPHDKEDIAVIDGRGLSRLFEGFQHSYIEIAHFTVKNFGTYTTSIDTGFWKCASGSHTISHVYFHDIHMIDVNRERLLESSINTFSWFGGSTNEFIAFENFKIENLSGYMSRGSSGLASDKQKDGPIRFKNFEVSQYGLDFKTDWTTGVTLFKIWGYFEYGFEVLDSVFDSRVPHVWISPQNGHVSGVLINLCARNFVVRNNHFIDYTVAVGSYGFTGYQSYSCWDRSVDNVVVDHNLVTVNTEHYIYGAFGIHLSNSDGGPVTGVIDNYEITNNIFCSSVGWQSCISYDGGNNVGSQSGKITIRDNTCKGAPFRYDHGAITVGEGSTFSYRHQNFEIQGNTFENMGGKKRPMIDEMAIIYLKYTPSQFDSDTNIFDPLGEFFIEGNRYNDFLSYQTATNYDLNSITCNDCSNATNCPIPDRTIPNNRGDKIVAWVVGIVTSVVSVIFLCIVIFIIVFISMRCLKYDRNKGVKL